MKTEELLHQLNGIAPFIGNTPLKKLHSDEANLYVKLEYNNYSGSCKDRAAFNILSEAIRRGEVDEDSVIVGSSSGNFAIACATICKTLGIKYVPVIDPNVNKEYEKLLRLLSYDVVKVSDLDETDGYLLTRIRKVEQICRENRRAYCADQYTDPNNYLAYYHSLGPEICKHFSRLDYVFVAVSTGGTITGVSRRVKEKFPLATIVAVDVEGSVIFGQKPQKRHVSGLGASQVPPILRHAAIDEVIHVSQANIVRGCHALLQEQLIFGGASTGAVYYAVKSFFGENKTHDKPTVLFICPDKGNGYLNSVYDANWVDQHLLELQEAV